MSTNTKDEVALQLLQKIQEKKNELTKLKKPEWKTNCVFTIDGKISNIRTINDEEKVIHLFASLLNQKNTFVEGCKLLNAYSNIFNFCGYSFNDWTNDFKNVVGLINIKRLEQELNSDIINVDKLVSKEKKEELELLAMLKKYE